MKRLILTTGGTGGHIFPALAVAESVRAAAPDCEILFVGSERGPEGEWARKAGLPFVALRSEERRVGKECRSRWSPYH